MGKDPGSKAGDHKPLVLFLGAILFLTTSRGQDFPIECLRAGSTPEANASTLRAVAFNSDRFVAVGDSGMIVLSTNTVNWQRQPTPTTSALYGLTYGAGRFVAVGDAGCVLQSTNGGDWLLANAGPTNNLRKIAFGNGHFVASTDLLTLLRSADGLNWEPSTNGLPTVGQLIGVYFGGGLFVGFGYNGAIYTSSDGLNWSNRSVSAHSAFTCGTYGNGVFITAGVDGFGEDQVAISTNGVTWTTFRHSTDYQAFCFGNGLLVGLGGRVRWSVDGFAWTDGPGSINCYCSSIAFGLGQFVAVGLNGAIWTSSDLATWTQRNATVCPIVAFAEGNGVSVGISRNFGVIYSSQNQVDYTRRRDPGGSLTSITFGQNLFVTVGIIGPLISNDGTNWTSVPAPAPGILYRVRFEQNLWVAVGQSIISSENGSNWVLRVQSPGYLTDLVYGDGRFVGCGWDGAIWSSADGTNWLDCSYATTLDLSPGKFQGGLFSLYAEASFMQPLRGLVSKDGIHWYDAGIDGPLLSLRANGSLGFLTLALAGEWGRPYLLRHSTNLGDWIGATMITNTAGVTSVTVTNSLNSTPMFLDAVAQ